MPPGDGYLLVKEKTNKKLGKAKKISCWKCKKDFGQMTSQKVSFFME